MCSREMSRFPSVNNERPELIKSIVPSDPGQFSQVELPEHKCSSVQAAQALGPAQLRCPSAQASCPMRLGQPNRSGIIFDKKFRFPSTTMDTLTQICGGSVIEFSSSDHRDLSKPNFVFFHKHSGKLSISDFPSNNDGPLDPNLWPERSGS